MPRQSRETTSRTVGRRLRLLLLGLLAAAPLALGGAHPQSNAVLLLGFAILVVIELVAGNRFAQLRADLPVTLLFGLVALTILQLLPMPPGLIERLSPGAHEVWSLADRGQGRWVPWSVDPPATAHALVRLTSYLGAALLALTLFVGGRRRRRLVFSISITGTALVVLGLAQAVLDIDRPYGIFGYDAGHFTSAFINGNHLAAFLGFAALLAIGLSLEARGRRRWLHLGNAALMIAGLLMTGSRGTIVALFGALLLLAATQLLRRGLSTRRLLWPQLGVLAGLLLAIVAAESDWVAELWTLSQPESYSKVELWRQTPRLLQAFPLLGMGRDAFASGFGRFHPGQPLRTFTHLENEWLQALVDWGVIPGIAILIALSISVLAILRRGGRDPLFLGVGTALAFLGLQNLGDFNLHLTGLALPATTLLTVFYAAARRRQRTEKQRETIPVLPRRALLVGAAVALAGGLAAIWPAWRNGLGPDTERAKQLLRSELPLTEIRAELQSITARHPADHLLPLLIADWELSRGDGPSAAMPWINRSMVLAPWSPGAHLVAGDTLLRAGGVDQAVLEYALGCGKAPHLAPAIANRLLQRTGSLERLAQLGKRAERCRVVVARLLLQHRQPALVLDLVADEAAADLSPEMLEVVASARVELGELDAATATARHLVATWPQRDSAYLVLALAQERAGEQRAALDTLQRGAAVAARRDRLLERRALILLRSGAIDAARDAAAALMGEVAYGPPRARAHWLTGEVLRAEGRLAIAVREMQRAKEHDPKTLLYRLAIADIRIALGDTAGARHELQAARIELGESPTLDAALRRLDGARPAP